MTENKRFVLTDFDTELEMLELLNTQAEVISDLSEQNEELKIKFHNCNNSYWKLHDGNHKLKQQLFETSKELLWATSDEVDRALHYEDEVEELRKEIFE